MVIGTGSTAACIDIVGVCESNRFVEVATAPTSFEQVPAGRSRLRRLAPTIARMLARNAMLVLKAQRRGVRTKFIRGSALIANKVGPMIFEAFLPKALAATRFVAAPCPTVVGTGLAQIPAAFESQRQGVSAAKLVVMLCAVAAHNACRSARRCRGRWRPGLASLAFVCDRCASCRSSFSTRTG